MPGTPTKKTQVFSALTEFAGKIGDALGIEGTKTAAESLSAYTQLESLMKQINLDSTRSLRKKKNDFFRDSFAVSRLQHESVFFIYILGQPPGIYSDYRKPRGHRLHHA